MGKKNAKITGDAGTEVSQDAASQATEAVEKAKASAKSRGPRGVAEDAVITVLAGANPKRAGTRAHGLWELYANGMTVGAYADAVQGAGLGTDQATPALVYDAKHGFISIAGYDPGAIITPKPKAPKAPKKTEKVAGEPSAGDVQSQAEATAEQME